MKITQYYRNKKTQNSDSIISILLRLMINYDVAHMFKDITEENWGRNVPNYN